MSEETETQIPVEALLAEITAIDPRIIPLAVERMRNRLLQAEVEELRGARGEP
jgi:hypothetical protein